MNLKKIAASLVPDEDVLAEVEQFVQELNRKLRKARLKAEAMAGGSVAKGTFLKGDYDVDIFVRFDPRYLDKDISGLLGKVLKPWNPERIHGSRDYYQIRNGLVFEVVPVIKVEDPAQAANVTDMSPLHVAWVRKHRKYIVDIRLAKAFCKAAHAYGAESYISGFSGHVLDILVIYYNGFLPLLRASLKWKQHEVIDTNKVYRGTALQRLNKAKISPLIVIDPLMPERNAAAALSREKIELFRQAARDFLRKQSEEFFIAKEITIEDVKEKARDKRLVILKVVPKKGKKDVIGSKLLKAFEHIRLHLLNNDFELLDAGWNWGKETFFYFILKKEVLPPEEERIGPPVRLKRNVEEFKAKYQKVFVRGDRIFARIQRKYRRPEELLRDMCHDPYVKEKLRQVQVK
ncbi:nucleotidyltransferase domain-containing protein [Candidatus Woesearchaeota archaeon]|nr:nucleotidyltransferase domain-containing protein [Candidatus Woesearchaeota archaeon]